MARLSFVLAAAFRDLRRTGAAGAGGVLLIALAVIVINFAVDLVYLVLDPRIRYA